MLPQPLAALTHPSSLLLALGMRVQWLLAHRRAVPVLPADELPVAFQPVMAVLLTSGQLILVSEPSGSQMMRLMESLPDRYHAIPGKCIAIQRRTIRSVARTGASVQIAVTDHEQLLQLKHSAFLGSELLKQLP